MANLERSLQEWRRMIGSDDDLTMTINRESGEDVDSPKFGKVDPENTPHVGGNTWVILYWTEHFSSEILS